MVTGCACQHERLPDGRSAMLVNRGCPIHGPKTEGHFAAREDGTLVDLDKLHRIAPYSFELLDALKACVSEIECTPQCARGAAENARALIARLEGLG